MTRKKDTKLIVTIDGGGIRGILPLLMLNHINSLLKDFSIESSIDFISGTSTGAIISAGLSTKKNGKPLFTPASLLTMYRKRGPSIFRVQENSSPSERLGTILKRKFGKFALKDITAPFAFVSFDMKTKKPFIFHANKKEESNLSLPFVLAACSAVPGLFEPLKYGEHELVDGYLAYKNPTRVAYELAQEQYPNSSLIVASFGTGGLSGEMVDEIEKKSKAIESYMDEENKRNGDLSYFRFQPPVLIADPQMDSASPENIKALLEDGKRYISSTGEQFQRFVERLKQGRS